MLNIVTATHFSQCFVNNIDLWHKRLGHFNFKTLSKIADAGLVHELPTLGKKSPSMCGSCQFKFSKEEEITSLSDEAIEKSSAYQNVETKLDNVATLVTLSHEKILQHQVTRIKIIMIK